MSVLVQRVVFNTYHTQCEYVSSLLQTSVDAVMPVTLPAAGHMGSKLYLRPPFVQMTAKHILRSCDLIC